MANLWTAQNVCHWPSNVTEQSVTHLCPIWVAAPATQQLDAPSLFCVSIIHNIYISYSEVTSGECGRETMTNTCITFEMYLYCVSVSVLHGGFLCCSWACVWEVLDDVSCTLSWGVLDLWSVPAVKQQQPYREPLSVTMFTILHSFYGFIHWVVQFKDSYVVIITAGDEPTFDYFFS